MLRDYSAIKKHNNDFSAAEKALQLTYARDKSEISIDLLFDDSEKEVFEMVHPAVNGKSEKQQNPYKKTSLAWAAWIVTRLVGWPGMTYSKPPGPTTMTKGLDKFYAHYWFYINVVNNKRG